MAEIVSEHSSAYQGDFGALKLKFAENPKLATMKDLNQRMPLHWACSGGRDDIVDLLLNQMEVPLNEQDDAGWTPLMIASSAGHESIVIMLLEKSADIHIINFTGQSCLHYAASKNQATIAMALLQSGAEVNIQDKTTGASPLHRAASKGHIKMVELLVENDAIINMEDNYKNTPLHLACEEERIDVIFFLVRHGGDLNARNKENKLPSDLAPDYLRRKIQELHS